MAKLTKKEVIDLIYKNNNINTTVSEVLNKLNMSADNIIEKDLKRLRNSLSLLKSRHITKFNAARRMKSRYDFENSDWLSSEFIFSISNSENMQNISQSRLINGRPTIQFEQQKERTQRRYVSTLSANANHNPERLLIACRYAAKRQGNNDLCNVVNEVLKSPEQPTKIRKCIAVASSIRIKTAEEALSFLLNNSMQKLVYQNMRLESKNCGANIWPAYNHVRDAKSLCRPPKEAIVITEKKAIVTLQSLLNHTASRLVELQNDVFVHHMQKKEISEIDTVLMCSWGMDGSTGHSTYMQHFQSTNDNESPNDANMFIVSLIPLRLLTADNVIIWNNVSCQSPVSCRPIQMLQISESKDVVLSCKRDIEEQINNLQTLKITLNKDINITIHFSLFLTLIDGKVLNIVTGTKSMQTCPICHATPKSFNDLSNKSKETFIPNTASLVYGISPLHAWIRVFECCLHLSYRLSVKAWQMRSNEQKAAFAERKKEIQKALWEKMALVVDKPKAGGAGTTNNGNAARRAFKDPDTFANILGLNCELIRNFKNILVSISIHLPINPDKFEELCNATAEIYVINYNWYPMPATLHKILIHGSDIMRTCLLPTGMLGEEASEARNKDYKNYRLFNSRKINREANITDVFYRIMDTSDPIINAMNLQSRLKNKQNMEIPDAVKKLLAVIVQGEEEDDDDDEEIVKNNEDNDVLIAGLDDIELSDEDEPNI